jgi:unsaturated rhamnogalacturonyl hydrolase
MRYASRWAALIILALGTSLVPSSWSAETKVVVANDLDLPRKSETIELNWQDLLRRQPSLTPDSVIVRDAASGQELVTQVVDDKLIFQADFAPKASEHFVITTGKPMKAESKVFGRFVPERLDDFAWENDQIAHRMYGPAIEKVEPPSGSGIDVWCKSTNRLVINDWYKRDDYHVDHGEGVDCYKVGPDRGCGGTAVWKNGQFYTSRDFRHWKVLANGPIRVMFELGYEPWDADGVKVSETKRISLDAGTHFNRMQSTFTFDGADNITVGVGLNEHPDFHVLSSIKDGWMGVWDHADRPKGLTNGMNGVGVVFPNGVKFVFKEAAQQVWFLTDVKAGQPLNYYAGAGWSKGGFPEMKDWEAYVADFAKRAHSPLKVQIEP